MSPSGIVPPRLLLALAVVCAFAVVFVGSEVLEGWLFPAISTGAHHALLTLRAAVMTAAASLIVYAVMFRQQRRLADTANRLTHLLESYEETGRCTERFHNPHLAHCADVLRCGELDCPLHDTPGERCWQVAALCRRNGSDAPVLSLQECHECEVYRRSCPDALTELGEGFNNLMFLLEKEGEKVGQMRAQLVEKEKMVAIGQIAAGIGHEVCNPLSSISSVVQMLKRARSATLKTEELNLIETNIERISSTVRQLVSLARPTVEEWARVDLGEILDEVVQLITFDQRARDVEIEFERPEGLPETYALRDQLTQVFINLSLNALDAMPDGGHLRIGVEEGRGRIVVRVRDTGCGIDPAIGRRVFEPFFTTKEPGRGTGLGLAVSYSIVEKHGGTMEFDSAPGEGSVFSVTIPVLTSPPDADHD